MVLLHQVAAVTADQLERPGARLRGVVPGELGLGWGTGGCKRCGLGREAGAGKQAVGEVGIGDEGHDDSAATAAGALERPGEHPAPEIGPWQPARARHGRRATQGEARRRGWAVWPWGSLGEWRCRGCGGHERGELRANFAGRAEQQSPATPDG